MKGIKKTMTWFTCTPVSFSGGSDFFCRDSGLICKELQSLGIPCKSIMPLPAHSDDVEENLIRTDSENLTNPVWWQNIGANNVILYSWAHYKYRKIAEAVRNSGAKVFINLDGSGIMSPVVTPKLYFHAIMGRYIRKYGYAVGALIGALRCIAYRFYIPFIQEPGRIVHLKTATAIGCISPAALDLWRLWARTYAPELVERMHLVPNPVADYLIYNPAVSKNDSVVAVSRWGDEETKRPALLAATIEKTAKQRGTTEFHIFGNPGKILPKWHNNLTSNIRKRIHIHGKVFHEELVDFFMQCRVGLCSSSHEGSHVPSAEALCSGASIVAPFRKELNAMLWYVSHDSGRLAIQDSANGLSETLLLELEAWDRGERNPVAISSYWCSKLSVSAVASRIRELLE